MKRGLIRLGLGLFLLLSVFALLARRALADDVDYSIPNYDAQLTLHEDNSADFVQEITYRFDSDYNGQIITLGKAGNMPASFAIAPNPKVATSRTRGGKTSYEASPRYELENLGDGYKLKVYNGGRDGDVVKVTVQWHLKQMLFHYQDVAELNWTPISDWDETLQRVHVKVVTDKPVKDSQLWAHRGAYIPALKATKLPDNRGFELTATDVSGKLELHGYWAASYLSASSNDLVASDKKATIIKQEKAIVAAYQKKYGYFVHWLPAGLALCLPLLATLSYAFLRQVRRFEVYPKNSRLYEAPEDLSPLQLSQSIYDVDLASAADSHGQIGFSELVQATLLDLIDRGVLTYDGHLLQVANHQKATASDRNFITFAFGDATQLAPEQLFQMYHYDYDAAVKQLKKRYSGSELEEKVRSSSRPIRATLSSRQSAVKRAVQDELDQMGFVSPYTDLSKTESRLLDLVRTLPILLALVTGILMIRLFMVGASYAPIYIGLLALSLLLAGLIWHLTSIYRLKGRLTQEGAFRVYQWQSLKNMIKAVNSFDRAELESVVVWNRILVYATLFGYADRVEKALKVHGICLPEQFSQLNLATFAHSLALSSHRYESTTSGLSSASHFSVSSGSSGASSGFSGGGGGGGGGAF